MQFCHQLDLGLTTALLLELGDISKATFECLSVVGSQYSQVGIGKSEGWLCWECDQIMTHL